MTWDVGRPSSTRPIAAASVTPVATRDAATTIPNNTEPVNARRSCIARRTRRRSKARA